MTNNYHKRKKQENLLKEARKSYQNVLKKKKKKSINMVVNDIRIF